MTEAAQKAPTPAVDKPFKLPAFQALKTEQDASQTELVILPDPVGWHMLIALPTMQERSDGGIIIPDTVNDRERAATVVGRVLAMGELCYLDTRKFGPSPKPWCKVGDTVLFSRYSGMRFRAKDLESGDMVEYRMLADDNIVGTVPAGAEVGAL